MLKGSENSIMSLTNSIKSTIKPMNCNKNKLNRSKNKFNNKKNGFFKPIPNTSLICIGLYLYVEKLYCISGACEGEET